MSNKKKLSPEHAQDLLKTLKTRFEKNMNRHKGIDWNKVQAKLEASPEKLWTLDEMEITGGEPDVVSYDNSTGKYIFYDCSTETPKDRRSICYDQAALESGKEHKLRDSAMNIAAVMGKEVYQMIKSHGVFLNRQ